MPRLALLATAGIAAIAGAGCPQRADGPADARETLPQSPDGHFVLYVSNQSFAIDPVDIRVTIDGKTAVDDTFHVRNQHNWKQHSFALSPGSHTLKAQSRKGKARFTTQLTTGERNWAVLDYWYYPDDRHGAEPTEPKFSLRISDQPIAFM